MNTDDLDTVLAWRNHRAVREHMFEPGLVDVTEHAAWFARQRRRDDVELLLFERHGVARGYVRLDLHRSCSRAEWGFYAAPDAAPGTGRAMGETALAHVFDELGLHRLTGQVLATNVRSRRFHERLGFTTEGVLRDQHRVGTRYVSVHCFGLIASEWRAHRRGRTGSGGARQ